MCIADLPGWNAWQAAAIRRASRSAHAKLVAAGIKTPSALNFFRAFLDSGGLIVRGAGWTDESAAALVRAILRALENGSSAHKAAQELSSFAALDPDAVLELLVTEINRANGEAYMAGAAQAPAVAGFRFMLSPRHLQPDICDLLASQNLYGLGAGVYPSRELMPWLPHPGALSFVVAVFDDQVTAEARAGQETALQALARLPPNVREGVLGPTKASYFARGLLRHWMIRSPLSAVQRRLVRQGLIDASALETDPDPWVDDDA